MTDERRETLVEVAWLHHEYGLTQEEIARRLDVSRSTVSRLLADAERAGIVRVVLTEPMRGESRLAADLAMRLGMTAAVGGRAGHEAPPIAAARAAARLIERIADAGSATIAVSWGRTLAATASMVHPRVTHGITVVDAVGHAGGEQMTPAVDVTRSLAAALGATVVHLPSPAFVSPGASRDALLGSEPVRRAIEIARHADATFVSIGVAGQGSRLVDAGLVSTEAMHALLAAGARGEILGHWFDAAGREMQLPDGLALPVAVGLAPADLRVSRRVIGVAGGAEKADAVLAALAGGIVRELVIDDSLAQALLDAADPLLARASQRGTA